MECNEIHRIPWNPMNFTWFCVRWHWFWCLSGLSEASRGVSGRSTGALRGHLTIFDKYVENSKIWITPFWGLLEQMSNIPLVLLMFLRGHFEAILHCVAIFRHFTIHFKWKLRFVFNDFDVLSTQTKKDWCSLSVAVCRSKCISALSEFSFWYWFLIFPDARVLIFVSHTCWRQRFIWDRMEASWAKYAILSKF